LVAEGERAVAGGGRYDGLVELMGGPSTPAVGFAMGDVVLGLLLEEKGLMPGDGELAGAVDAVRRSYSLRPEVFVVGNGDDGSVGGEDCEGMVVPLVSALRRGVEVEGWGSGEWDRPWEPRRYAWGEGGVRPLHVRVTSKSTRNMKKLKGEADRVGARLFCEIHGSEKVELTDLDRGEALTPGVIAGMPGGSASFSVDPSSAGYVGRAAVRVLGGGAFGEGGGS
jgi:histidyl-tRNA synthetase